MIWFMKVKELWFHNAWDQKRPFIGTHASAGTEICCLGLTGMQKLKNKFAGSNITARTQKPDSIWRKESMHAKSWWAVASGHCQSQITEILSDNGGMEYVNITIDKLQKIHLIGSACNSILFLDHMVVLFSRKYF